MNVQIAAIMTRDLIKDVEAERGTEGRGLPHAAALLDAVIAGEYKNDPQANRWLAWAQCVLFYEGAATLDDFKSINKAA